MADTGAEPNIIKLSALKDSYNTSDKIKLVGITSGYLDTLGTIDITLLGHPVKFRVVPDTFPIKQSGILGANFFNNHGSINFRDKEITWRGYRIAFYTNNRIDVPARSRKVIRALVTNPHVDQGFVSLQNQNGIMWGNAVVRNTRGRTCLCIINTTEASVRMEPPVVNLLDFEEANSRAATLGPALEHRNANQADLQLHADGPTLGHPAALSCSTVKSYERTQEVLKLLRIDHLNAEELSHVKGIVEENSDLFHIAGDKLGYTNVFRHSIPTTDSLPINTKQYRYPPVHKDEITKQVNELLDNAIIQPSTSPYNSPLWIVPKKPDSQGNKRWRMVIDFRALNEKTIGDAYPLPNINEILDQLGGAKYFSVFDLASGFHQIKMDSKDMEKTAFSTPYGHYEYTRMPFGLKNAPATFQRLMNTVLSGLQGLEAFVYLDDIVLYASSLTEHRIKFNKLAARLRQATLTLQPDKCEFLRHEVTYLGHIIGSSGVRPDPKKLTAVKDFPRPKNAKNIKQFLGLAGYYRRFIPQFSKISKPLTNLLKKDIPFKWDSAQNEAFVTLRDKLCEEPILQYPDFSKDFVVTTDASGLAIGGVLSQGIIGKDLPISYASRLLNPAEQNYSTIEKELLAIVYCVQQFRPYLFGRRFKLVTDHKPLVWIHSVKDPTSRLVRWRLKLAEYEYDVIYKAGSVNLNADALSRNPPPAPIPTFPISSDSSDDIFSRRPSRPRLPSPTGQASSPMAEEDTTTDRSLDDPDSPITALEQPLPSTSDNQSESMEEETTPTSDSESSPEEILQRENIPYELEPPPRMIETRESILSRRDNLVTTLTMRGDPVGKGPTELCGLKDFPKLEPTIENRCTTADYRGFKIIGLPVKTNHTHQVDMDDLQECIKSLRNVTDELNLPTISISKGCIDNVPFITVRRLLHRVFTGSNTKIIICQGVITTPPEEQRPNIVKENHSSTIGGHKGVTKTYARIRQTFNWPGLKDDVRNYIKTCVGCQTKKMVRLKTRQPMTLTDTPGNAFDKVALDIVGPLPPSPSNKTHILTIQDLLTKYSIAVPLQQTTSRDISDAFINNFVCIFGSPKAILTDQGTNFTSAFLKHVAKRFRINQVKTTAFHPQSNGSLERSHQVLVEYLKQYVSNRNDWDAWLNMAMFSYNTSLHEGTKYTPYELVFGVLARTPSEIAPVAPSTDETCAAYLEALNERLRVIRDSARVHLEQSKIKSKTYYDKLVRPKNFKVGDKVYLLKEPRKGKFDDQYIGPYLIIEILSSTNVKIRIKNRDKIVHTNKLKPAY